MIGRQTIALAVLLAFAGVASAQAEEPTVNDSDYDTTVPANDEAYLDEGNTTSGNTTSSDATDPTVSDADFDTTVPTNDEAYLEESTPPADGGATPATSAKGTPGPALVGILAGVAVLALAVRRR